MFPVLQTAQYFVQIKGLTSLRATPRISKCSHVNIEFRLAKATSRNGTGRVGNLLYNALGGNEIIDESSQRRVFAKCVL